MILKIGVINLTIMTTFSKVEEANLPTEKEVNL